MRIRLAILSVVTLGTWITAVSCKTAGGERGSQALDLAAVPHAANVFAGFGAPGADYYEHVAIQKSLNNTAAVFQKLRFGFTGTKTFNPHAQFLLQQTAYQASLVGDEGTLLWYYVGHSSPNGNFYIGGKKKKKIKNPLIKPVIDQPQMIDQFALDGKVPFEHVFHAMRSQRTTPFRRLVLVLDTCYSGNMISHLQANNPSGPGPVVPANFRIGINLATVVQGGRQHLYVKNVSPGQLAEQYGLRAGDYILSINGQAVRAVDEYDRAIDQAKINQSPAIVFHLNRNGQTGTVSIPFAMEARSAAEGLQLADGGLTDDQILAKTVKSSDPAGTNANVTQNTKELAESVLASVRAAMDSGGLSLADGQPLFREVVLLAGSTTDGYSMFGAQYGSRLSEALWRTASEVSPDSRVTLDGFFKLIQARVDRLNRIDSPTGTWQQPVFMALPNTILQQSAFKEPSQQVSPGVVVPPMGGGEVARGIVNEDGLDD